MRIHVFQGPAFSGSSYFKVQVQGPGPGFSGARFRVRFQVLEVVHYYDMESEQQPPEFSKTQAVYIVVLPVRMMATQTEKELSLTHQQISVYNTNVSKQLRTKSHIIGASFIKQTRTWTQIFREKGLWTFRKSGPYGYWFQI